jgi:hypothetical protein
METAGHAAEDLESTKRAGGSERLITQTRIMKIDKNKEL